MNDAISPDAVAVMAQFLKDFDIICFVEVPSTAGKTLTSLLISLNAPFKIDPKTKKLPDEMYVAKHAEGGANHCLCRAKYASTKGKKTTIEAEQVAGPFTHSPTLFGLKLGEKPLHLLVVHLMAQSKGTGKKGTSSFYF